MEPGLAKAHYNLGNVLKEQGRLDEAETSYRQAIDSDDNMGEAYLGLSHILRKLGNLEDSSDMHIKGL